MSRTISSSISSGRRAYLLIPTHEPALAHSPWHSPHGWLSTADTDPPITPARFIDECAPRLISNEKVTDLGGRLKDVCESVQAGESTTAFAARSLSPKGVSGYINHTVPIAIHAWLRYPEDYRTAVQECIRCGGDTDTVAGIAGALVGIRVGKAGIPAAWIDGIIDWPLTPGLIDRLGHRLAESDWLRIPQHPVPMARWAVLPRNFLFLLIVLAHVARRLLPPY